MASPPPGLEDSKGGTEDDAVAPCPCHEFASSSLEQIRQALLDNEERRVTVLVEWLCGSSTISNASLGNEQPRLSCSSTSTCRKRIKASFMILNGIRDACRPYLEVQQQQSAAETNGGTTT